MPRVLWPLHSDQPAVQIVLTAHNQNPPAILDLLADTGAGDASCPFDLLLRRNDCLQYGGVLTQSLTLGGAYTGLYSIYRIRVRIPQLLFDRRLDAVAIPICPRGFAGIAGFRFLRRFTYGNFGHPDQFGLEL